MFTCEGRRRALPHRHKGRGGRGRRSPCSSRRGRSGRGAGSPARGKGQQGDRGIGKVKRRLWKGKMRDQAALVDVMEEFTEIQLTSGTCPNDFTKNKKIMFERTVSLL